MASTVFLNLNWHLLDLWLELVGLEFADDLALSFFQQRSRENLCSISGLSINKIAY